MLLFGDANTASRDAPGWAPKGQGGCALLLSERAHLIGKDVPDAVAGKNEELVGVGELKDAYIWVGRDYLLLWRQVRIELVFQVPYCPRQVEVAVDSCNTPNIIHCAPGCLNARPLRLLERLVVFRKGYCGFCMCHGLSCRCEGSLCRPIHVPAKSALNSHPLDRALLWSHLRWPHTTCCCA